MFAFGCFNPDKSDIDFLAVADDPPSLDEKEAIIRGLIELEAQGQPKGLEMSIVLQSHCKPFVYPTPFELHYSGAHRERALADLQQYCEAMQGSDRDLAAHITVINTVGITLCGRDRSLVFEPVPRACYLDSILADVADVADAADRIEADPEYYVLNLCRALAIIESGMICSKESGGRWALRHLPAAYKGPVMHALASYGGSSTHHEKHGLGDFAGYVLGRIHSASRFPPACPSAPADVE